MVGHKRPKLRFVVPEISPGAIASDCAHLDAVTSPNGQEIHAGSFSGSFAGAGLEGSAGACSGASLGMTM